MSEERQNDVTKLHSLRTGYTLFHFFLRDRQTLSNETEQTETGTRKSSGRSYRMKAKGQKIQTNP